MSFIAFFVLGVYTVALFYITVYCLMQFNLLYHYRKASKKEQDQENNKKVTPAAATKKLAEYSRTAASRYAGLLPGDAPAEIAILDEEAGEYPFVTVQLPVFNEKYVIERLIDTVARFDYPKDRFEIHILDDSTDETVEITRQKVEEYKDKGFQIEQITREERQGFKAGALRDAMAYARGEFIAIFDADFLPRPDFLKRTIPCFQDEEVGVVQTRWEHINEEYSLITRLQALQLNVHFTVEQKGRMAGDYLLQFNGTAGIWRRAAIEEAGGWEADTLTEDLDLSIRAQLKGWKILFLEEVGSPAELPVEMSSFKSQQFRWMKGGAETARKMLPSVWRSDLGLWKKIQATAHLLASTIFVFVFLTGVFSVPLLFFLGDLTEMGFDKDLFAYFLAGLLSIIAVYYHGNVTAPIHRESSRKAVLKFLFLFPLFLALSMGLSLHNSVAVIQGWLGRKSAFIRTPKFNIQTIKDNFIKNTYLSRELSWTTIGEGLMTLYFLGAAIAGVFLQNMTFLVFHGMLALGFGAIFYLTVRHLSLK
jgi:cellulose synthase/poly-beta-1,6-N-acetylglucosamine synthase-like glycosyltransferase